jgi:glycosyltransferase involved in cell wall biosynthesis
MLPPFPLLLAGLIHALRTDAAIVADLHTGAFLNPRWAWSTALALRLLRPHTVVVTNEHLAERCRQAGIRSVLVLHDPLAVREAPPLQHARPQVVCPVSYANDEPIEAMLEAARQTSELDWVLTGRAPAEVRRAAPANLRFAGWLDDAAFENLLAEADVVVALTTRPHTMQRAGYEALMWGKPLVTSEFPVLSEFFGEAAVTVEPHAAAIASGVRDAVERSSELQSAARRVLDERIREQDAALAALREIIRS